MKISLPLALLLFLLSFVPTLAQAAVDPGASVVQLRQSCQVNGSTLDNCFTDLTTLNSWIWNTRNPSPSATNPLLVKIGPGTFDGQFTCTNAGDVSLKGSGVNVSIISNGMEPINTQNCTNMAYSNLTVKNTENLFGVREDGGTSVWNNAEIDGLGYAWFDGTGDTCNVKQGSHYFYSSRVVANTIGNNATAWYDDCDKSWFFGSQIQAIGGSGAQVRVIEANGGEVHVYGGNIEALTQGDVSPASMVAVTSDNSGIVHLHGTGIDVISQGNNNITALSAGTGGLIHAVADGYFMNTNGGTMTRVNNNGGIIMAPYHWPASSTPPAVISASGSDTAVVTKTSDGHPHPLVYDATCSSHWFDTVARACW